MDLEREIEKLVSRRVIQITPLSGGCVGQVYCVVLENGLKIVAKSDDRDTAVLDLEGYMLTFLADNSDLPVPTVLHSSEKLLLMSFMSGESRFSRGAQEHAAELLSSLHKISAPAFGFGRDTLIGGLPQPNPWSDLWLDFFRDQRLIYMANEGVRTGRLPEEIFIRLQRFCERLDRWIEEPESPGLIHGDVWTANVLAEKDLVVGFIDPAIYFADPEIELAFTTLFGTFSTSFFDRYQELTPIRPGFFEERREIYNLYPLLVHVRLFGDSYVNGIDSTLRRFGF
ncbi:MAG: fructosamine kinase family protein [Candidatus Promineifilaceae bacterium]|nr:fructosamine kinase family protein [Candidatus Promineifilaceae bacterium]